MAFALLPAIQASGAVVARALPSLAKAAKNFAPTAYSQLAKYTGSKDPMALAQSIATNRNGMQASAYLMNAVKAGITLEMISSSVPLLSQVDMDMLREHHATYTMMARNAVSAAAVIVPTTKEVEPPSAEVIVAIKQFTKLFNLSLLDMTDMITTIHTVTPAHILQLTAWQAKTGVVIVK